MRTPDSAPKAEAIVATATSAVMVGSPSIICNNLAAIRTSGLRPLANSTPLILMAPWEFSINAELEHSIHETDPVANPLQLTSIGNGIGFNNTSENARPRSLNSLYTSFVFNSLPNVLTGKASKGNSSLSISSGIEILPETAKLPPSQISKLPVPSKKLRPNLTTPSFEGHPGQSHVTSSREQNSTINGVTSQESVFFFAQIDFDDGFTRSCFFAIFGNNPFLRMIPANLGVQHRCTTTNRISNGFEQSQNLRLGTSSIDFTNVHQQEFNIVLMTTFHQAYIGSIGAQSSLENGLQ
ncbi:hypothetical protein FF38_08024 [Lucilia cuprina]|uniref:Uncharacterized protein n=1 Tax=Lucilia cuprina TaxID=7375 RepID=A0A0L0BRZ7_LUCCU|nr:hypothetical protein FF38_08024 [Lucilia cuprina]